SPQFLQDSLNAIQAYAIDGEILPSLTPFRAVATASGAATGIEGHRLEGLTSVFDITKLFGADNVVSSTLANFAVTGLTKVIGSPLGDSLLSNDLGVEFVATAGDTVRGKLNLTDPSNAIDLFVEMAASDSEDAHIVRVNDAAGASHLTWLRGTDLVAGPGNDHYIGNDEDNTFYFTASDAENGWGDDLLSTGVPLGSSARVGRDIVDISQIPADWTWHTAEGLGGQHEIRFRDSDGELLTHKIRLQLNEKNEFVIRDASGIKSAGDWPKSSTPLSSGSYAGPLPQAASTAPLSVASVPNRLNAVPAEIVHQAVRAFDGLTVSVPNVNDGNDLYVLSAVEL
ncbi:MAG: hypothetical protein KDB23_33025, partial [Planctomycetales bacterium]|nr:hypothetical protein [Planctomycetales bacterium]